MNPRFWAILNSTIEREKSAQFTSNSRAMVESSAANWLSAHGQHGEFFEVFEVVRSKVGEVKPAPKEERTCTKQE